MKKRQGGAAAGSQAARLFEGGNRLAAEGRSEEAIVLFRKAAALRPCDPAPRFNAATLLLAMGRYDRAESELRTVVAISPGDAAAWNNLGIALLFQNRPADAGPAFQAAVAADSRYADAWSNLGLACEREGLPSNAEESYRAALAADPHHALANFHLGNLLLRAGKWEEARVLFERAHDVRPGWAECANSLGIALQRTGRNKEAAGRFGEATVLRPDWPEAWLNLGASLTVSRDYPGAIRATGESLRLRPDNPAALRNLSAALRGAGRVADALEACRKAIALEPGNADGHNSLGTLLLNAGEAAEAVDSFRKAIAIRPDNAAAHSNLLLALHYNPDLSPEGVFQEHVRFGQLHSAGIARLPLRRRPGGDGRILRVGYVSPDFRRHPAGQFVLPVLGAHDRSRFESYCYHTAACEDEWTPLFREASAAWRNAAGWSDAALAECIADDGIDILVDLSGHTSGNRLPVFARKPAPVSVTWLGYFNTTGFATIDYLVADRWVCPESTSQRFVEEVVRLPRCYLCYRGPDDAPAPESPDAGRPLVFGCFNNVAKIGARTAGTWAEILRRLPDASLMLKSAGLADAGVRERLFAKFRDRGVPAARLELLGPSSQRELLSQYRHVDIALDPFPYNGGITTCEALWMGVPVVSLAGESFASRVGLTLVTNCGRPEWAAATPEQYVDLAVRLAADRETLGQIRGTLRGDLQTSVLGDVRGFTRGLETAYVRMWQKHSGSARPEALACPA